MATVLLAAAGGAIGTSLGGALFGISAAVIGQAVGGLIGQTIDARLSGGGTIKQTGPRLDSLEVMVSQEGTPLADISGRVAVAGTVIWATKLEEIARTTSTRVGSGKSSQKVKSTNFDYAASFAVSLGEGPLNGIGRIFLDGQVRDLSEMISENRVRFYPGTEDQEPDPLIEAIEGAAPAFRGTAYLVFERLFLSDFGNRVPQVRVEVFGQSGEMEKGVTGVCVIPGSTEFGYMPAPVRQQSLDGADVVWEGPENCNRYSRISDWSLSMDHLKNTLPAVQTVSLVVAWFGTDLRAGLCRFEPRIELRAKRTSIEWIAAGLNRGSATEVSRDENDRPAFGSSPADVSVVRAIMDLKARGFRVVLYPFVMMDVTADQALPSPAGTGAQGAYPWRGRIMPDVTGGRVSDQIAALMGTAQPDDFTAAVTRNKSGEISQVNLTCPGAPGDAGLRRFILHLAKLADIAGGVDAFLVGTEFRGLSQAWEPQTYADAYEFLNSSEGWFAQNAARTHEPGSLLVSATARDPRLISPPLSIDGAAARWIEIEFDRTSAPVWEGNVYYMTEDHGFAGAFRKVISDAEAPADGTRARMLLDMHDLTLGGDDWRTSTITRLRFDFSSESDAVFRIHAIRLGGGRRYPFVDALRDLAQDVDTILPTAKISYAADWSEYHSHQDAGDLTFHLDPLWADPAIDFVGIDNYLPLSDWRQGADHLDYDATSGRTTPYDLDYLKSNIEGGEYWDWFYASQEDRDTQTRTPISDGSYGEPWVFRQKAIRDWHANAHHNRTAGVRATTSTGWVPGSKPVWFTEYGCPAVDLGANRPNVFAAASSSESALPWYSSGLRDDFMQRQYLRAMAEWWTANGAPAVDLANCQAWAWDARPFPEFPLRPATWSDGPDWRLGHWLNGRAGAAPAAEAITRRAITRHGLISADIDTSRAYGQADGYAAPAPLGLGDYAQPFEVALGLQTTETGGALVIEAKPAAPLAADVIEADLVDTPAIYTLTRGALEDTPAAAIVRFRDGLSDYEITAARARIGAGKEGGSATADLALVLDGDRGNAAAEMVLRAALTSRESLSVTLPRSATTLRPGSLVEVTLGTEARRLFLVDRVVDGQAREVTLRGFDRAAYAPSGGVFKAARAGRLQGSTSSLTRFLDLPLLPGVDAPEWEGFIAAHAEPWPGAMLHSRGSTPEGSFTLAAEADARATIGRTTAALPPAPAHVWTPGPLVVTLFSGALVGRPDLDVLDGANALAIQHPDGWEVVQFREATLTADRTWRLEGLLRGQRGTDGIVGPAPLPAGAAVVAIDTALVAAGLSADDPGRALWWRSGPDAASLAAAPLRPHTFTAAGLRAFPPAHLRAVVTGGGDTSLSWVPRSRLVGTTWPDNGAPIPSGEGLERYQVTIGPTAAPVRVILADTPAATYTAAERAADGIAAPFRVAVSQISETTGPGPWIETIVTE
ncbi:tail protein [Dinoroseobacter phage vB_DshS-R4C]|uniref:Tail protein n=1 Tax=Dinoroseobacter phage vB_DshS-R4C TaxID=2590919 RepID=A0ACD6BAB7_9CAUD|nr:tail protein [Dinoroseobacter phage vB_DshS-R4C]8GTC_M Chain M, Megatron protein [Dinoroseobacter phage vB_DshS-R4C]8GTC_N Chain N, Megatron protein [Dinoroseobacter phage vB_DshS-R4C]8GTC_O Chain O, Megatron protein [Dinoroseobacter phage vB_DshS-R4C]